MRCASQQASDHPAHASCPGEGARTSCSEDASDVLRGSEDGTYDEAAENADEACCRWFTFFAASCHFCIGVD